MQALTLLFILQATFEMNMRAPALVPAFLGLSLLAIPAESRQYVGTCEDDFDCELGLKCIRTTNKNQVSRRFCVIDLASDKDRDGVPDGSKTLKRDNCPATANTDQADYDVDGIGDRCDKDIDADGVANAQDNCPFFHNPKQRESDTSLPECSLQLTRKGCVYRHPRFPTGCPVRVPVK